jgi:hypothetical protein
MVVHLRRRRWRLGALRLIVSLALGLAIAAEAWAVGSVLAAARGREAVEEQAYLK